MSISRQAFDISDLDSLSHELHSRINLLADRTGMPMPYAFELWLDGEYADSYATFEEAQDAYDDADAMVSIVRIDTRDIASGRVIESHYC